MSRYRVALVLAALIPLAFLAVFFVLPVGGMALRGLRPDGGWALGEAVQVLARDRVQRVLWFTVWMAALATLVTVLLGLPLAYVLHRLSFPGRRVLRALVVMPFVLPTVVVGVAFRTLLSASGPLGFLGIDGSWVAILLAMIFFNLAVVVRTVGGMWESLDPRAEDAAAALGAGPWQVFRTVTLPALTPAILSAASVVFLFCSTAFGIVLVLGGLRYSTIETEIYLLTANFLDLRAAAVLSLLQLVAVLLLLGVTEAMRSRRERALSRSGRTSRAPDARRSDALPVGLTALVVAFLLTPIGTLVVRSLRVDGAWSLQHYRRLAASDGSDALLVPVTQAMINSWRTALDATVIAMVLGVLVSVVVSRRGRSRRTRRGLSMLDAVFMLPLGISAVTVGFGFLVTLDRPPLDLRSSPVLVPIAQAMVALPLVVRTLSPVLRSLDPRQREAASTLGAGPLRAWLSVELPVVWRPLLAASGFAMAVSLGEFGATSFLARPERPTLPVVIYTLIGRPGGDNFGMALAASVVLALVTVTVMGAVERLRVGSLGSF